MEIETRDEVLEEVLGFSGLASPFGDRIQILSIVSELPFHNINKLNPPEEKLLNLGDLDEDDLEEDDDLNHGSRNSDPNQSTDTETAEHPGPSQNPSKRRKRPKVISIHW